MAFLGGVSRIACVLTLGLAAVARADGPSCSDIEVTFKPTPNMQIAIWVEDASGKYIDTVYVTRMTGTLGLANRPGLSKFKSDFRFPYGRRDMVLPVWANKRDKRYGYVVMGGKFGASETQCAANGIAASECDDGTIGYHFMVSSPEPFYCSPRGGVKTKVNGVDTMTCASSFYGSKGAYAAAPLYSLYPPRADLSAFVDEHDGNDAKGYAKVNDLGAVSGATPLGDKVVDPLRWTAPADGDYVLKIEASLEGDFNTFHNYPSVDDGSPELNGYGKAFLGQPSVVYAVPFTIGSSSQSYSTDTYEGYGDWDGATGTLHPADMTINTTDGSGGGRLWLVSGSGPGYRARVTTTGACAMPMGDAGSSTDGGTPGDLGCAAPPPPSGLSLTAGPTSIGVGFKAPASGSAIDRFEVRFRNGATISDSDFASAIPADSIMGTDPGALMSTTITGLRSETKYFVAARAVAECGATSAVVTAATTTKQAQFVTLHGCFIATAAFGTPMAQQIGVLRAIRDRYLLASPAGQLFVATYYSLAPPFARAIASDDWLRAGARAMLAPIVRVAATVDSLPGRH